MMTFSGCRVSARCFGALLLAAVFALAWAGAAAEPAHAATRSIDQCNGVNASPSGATTGLTCTVTVVNTINGTSRGSTTTVTRQCSLGPCSPGNGTFTTSSTSLVTNISQCNGSANDAAPPLVTCTVTVTNNISAGTSGSSRHAATVNQCVGTGTGGGQYAGRGPLVCSPYPASTTGATVTQCNGSVTGGGSAAVCSVSTASRISAAIPVRVNQCNGTGNKGGTLLTCSTSITTNILPLKVTALTPKAAVSATTTETTTSNGTTTKTTATAPKATTTSTTTKALPQVTRVPNGGLATGGGWAARGRADGLLASGVLLLASAAALAGGGVASSRRRR
jgi:hypothetical protein